MSDRNPSTKPKLIARGKIREDLFSHVFPSVEDELGRLGLQIVRGQLATLKGKKVKITITQEPDR